MARLSTFWLLLPLVLYGDATSTASTRSTTAHTSSHSSVHSSTHAVSNHSSTAKSSTVHSSTSRRTTASVRLSTGPVVSAPKSQTSGLSRNGTTTAKSSAAKNTKSSLPVVTIKTSASPPKSNTHSNTTKSSGPKTTTAHSSTSVHDVHPSGNSTSTAPRQTKSGGTTASGSKPASSKPSGSKSKVSTASGTKSASKSSGTKSNTAKSSPSAPGTGVLPFPTTTDTKATTSGKSAAPFTYSGTFSDAPPATDSPLNWFNVPTNTIPAPAATSEAVLLGGLFLALKSNRHWVTDPKLRSQYLDDIKKTKDETSALFNDLDVKPPSTPDCKSTSRKRSVMSEKQLRSLMKRGLLDGIANLAKDAVNEVANLISCANTVIDNLIDNVNVDVPKIDIIETLTDGLAEIGEDLKEADEDDKDSSSSDSKQTSTENKKSSSTSHSSATTCTGSKAVPVCTKTVSLSTSYYSGQASSYTVQTITSTACKTTTVAGCTASGTTATTVVSTSGATCTGYPVPDDDDPEEDGEDVSGDDYRKRSIAGRIKLAPRDRAPNRFGNCAIPANAALTIPGIPAATQVFSKDVAKPAATDVALLDGSARYFDRDVSCPGVVNLKKRAKSDIPNDPKNKVKGLNIADYSTDHIWELKLLLQFFQTITPPTSSGVFTDCNNFNEVFFPSGCNNVMQKLYDQVPTNTDASSDKQIEFAIMLKDLNNKKGVVFKPGEYTNSFWMKKNILVGGDPMTSIVTMQDIALAIAICQDPSVVPLFDKTNLRIYNAFQGIDNLVAKNKIGLKDTTFKFADAYETWMKGYLADRAADAWKFIQATIASTQTAIDGLTDATAKASAQTRLDNFKNGNFGKQAHYQFSFKTTLAGGGSAIGMKRSVAEIFERDSCPLPSRSVSASGSATKSTGPVGSGGASHSGKVSSAASAKSTKPSTSKDARSSSKVVLTSSKPAHTSSKHATTSSKHATTSSKPAPSSAKPKPSPTPTVKPKMTCHGIDNTKWLDPDSLADNIKSFCDTAAAQGVQDHNSGSISRSYDEVNLGIDWPSGTPFPGKDDCNSYLTGLMNNCDGNDPNNPMNWKHGGLWDLGPIKYHVDPSKDKYFAGTCGFHLHEIEHFHGVDGPGTERVHHYTTKVTAKDSKGNILVTTGDVDAGDPGAYSLDNVYYNSLIVLPEAQGNDYIQFSLGDQSWTTKEDGPQQHCSVGGWDGDYTPVGRDMDCSFLC